MTFPGFVYILASKKYGTLYTGVTNNLIRRIHEHKSNLVEGFSSKYQLHKLVYYEMLPNMEIAINREKQLKKYYRHKKIQLIESNNKEWEDLYAGIQK